MDFHEGVLLYPVPTITDAWPDQRRSAISLKRIAIFLGRSVFMLFNVLLNEFLILYCMTLVILLYMLVFAPPGKLSVGTSEIYL